MDERVLAERLIAYDTSRPDRLHAAAEFVKGWLEARDARGAPHRPQRPAGDPRRGRRRRRAADRVLHGHLDVVPAFEEQFTPRVEGDRLIGRGAYDMKGALAAMMCAVHDAAAQDAVRVRFVCVPDEESEDVEDRSTDCARARRSSQAPTSRSPASRPTCTSASRPRACSRSASRSAASRRTARRRGSATTRSSRRTTSSAGSRRCRSAASRRTCSTARRSTSRGSSAATPSTRSPTAAAWTSTSATCPGQDRGAILAQIRAIADVEIVRCFERAPAIVSRTQPVRARAARRGRAARSRARRCRSGATAPRTRSRSSRPASRRSSSGPIGGGHHGPDEWVSLSSLTRYRAGARRLRAAACPRELARSRRSSRPPARRRRRRIAAALTGGGSGGHHRYLRPPSVPPRAQPRAPARVPSPT